MAGPGYFAFLKTNSLALPVDLVAHTPSTNCQNCWRLTIVVVLVIDDSILPGSRGFNLLVLLLL
jgi:hypothetical protein